VEWDFFGPRSLDAGVDFPMLIISQLSPSARREALNSLASALRRNADYLAKRPDAIWQQLYNHLQWEPEPAAQLVAPELHRRTATGCPPWFWLRTPSEESALVRTLRGSGGSPFNAFVLHQALRIVVACDSSQAIRVWSLADGRLLAQYRLPYSVWSVKACALNADGTRMVVVTDRREAIVCDTMTGRGILNLNVEASIRHDLAPYLACAYSPDDALIATGGIGGVHVWDATTGVRHDNLTIAVDRCEGLAFTAGSSSLLLAAEYTLEHWKLGAPTPSWAAKPTKYAGGFFCCAVSPDGKVLATGGRDRASRHDKKFGIQRHAVKLWDVATGNDITNLDEFAGTVRWCAYSPEGPYLVTGDEDRQLTIWNLDNGQQIARFEAHSEQLLGCAFSTNGDFVLSAGSDSVRTWSVARAPAPSSQVVRTPAEKTLSTAWSSDGRFALSSHSNDVAKVWEPPTIWERTAFAHTYNLHARNYAQSCVFHPHASRIAIVTETDAVEVRLASDGAVRGRVGNTTNPERLCGWSPDGHLLITAGASDIHLWDAETLAARATLTGGTDEKANAFAMSPDGCHLVVAGEHTPILWSLDDEQTSAPLTSNDYILNIYECAFLPDGATIATASDRAVHLWDVATMRQREGIEFRYMHLSDMFARPPWAISPDGRHIAVSGPGVQTAHGLKPPIVIWDTRTGDHLIDMFGHEHFAKTLAFSPDGALLLTGGHDRAVKLWDVKSGSELLSLPLPDVPLSLAFHPWRPAVLIGGSQGNVYYAELVGVAHGPPIVTATDDGTGPTVRCPMCGCFQVLSSTQVGAIVECSQLGCSGRMRVNPFVTKMKPTNMRIFRETENPQ
jgi:WD40 repeat protein